MKRWVTLPEQGMASAHKGVGVSVLPFRMGRATPPHPQLPGEVGRVQTLESPRLR